MKFSEYYNLEKGLLNEIEREKKFSVHKFLNLLALNALAETRVY